MKRFIYWTADFEITEMIIAYLFCSYEKVVSFDMELILGIDMTNTKPRKLLKT